MDPSFPVGSNSCWDISLPVGTFPFLVLPFITGLDITFPGWTFVFWLVCSLPVGTLPIMFAHSLSHCNLPFPVGTFSFPDVISFSFGDQSCSNEYQQSYCCARDHIKGVSDFQKI